MKLYHIEYKNPIVFGRSQRSFGVKLNNKLGQLSYLVFGCTTLSKGDCFSGGQRSFEVNRGQIVKTL